MLRLLCAQNSGSKLQASLFFNFVHLPRLAQTHVPFSRLLALLGLYAPNKNPPAKYE
jgi:hypothetical protein